MGVVVGEGMGVGVGVGVAVGVKGGVGVAVGVGMGVAVEAGCEQPIATGRTKAMAIPISNNALDRISNATAASDFFTLYAPEMMNISTGFSA